MAILGPNHSFFDQNYLEHIWGQGSFFNDQFSVLCPNWTYSAYEFWDLLDLCDFMRFVKIWWDLWEFCDLLEFLGIWWYLWDLVEFERFVGLVEICWDLYDLWDWNLVKSMEFMGGIWWNLCDLREFVWFDGIW